MEEIRLIRFHHAGDVTVKGGHRLGPRIIDDYELVYFPAGNGTVYEAQGRNYPQDVPTVVVTRPGEPHHYTFDPELPTRHLFIHFDPADERLLERYSLLGRTAVCSIGLRRESLVPQLMNQLMYCFHTRPARWRQLGEMMLLSILEELESGLAEPAAGVSAEEASLPPQISTALSFMEAHLTEKLEIDRLARHVGWSHEHFSRTFQQHVGCSPKEWMTKRRIEHAAQLLLQRSDSVKAIARESGFGDEYYFHRLFRRRMGVTATEYRKKYGDPRFHELVPANGFGRFYPLNHFFALDAD
ncbi:AraC family transcriptional regulator [Paenibacillus thermotolerans]|uniref:AraC family transcriptional regulator n=1 Tax=Paenibacillus thermotolerans TaxID=3027807 RepID=UPI002368EBA8|nr:MULTISPECIES: AraC family transcriptional regulator [unclassified Paenibacillus]